MRLVLTSLILFGTLCCFMVFRDIANSPSLEEIRSQYRAMLDWPTVTGRLMELTLRKDLPHGKGAYWYRAQVRYDYEINGKSYSGARIGLQDYKSPSAEELEMKMRTFFTPSHVSDRKDNNDTSLLGTRAIVLSFTDQPIKVFYDPKTPASSILDPIDYEPIDDWEVFSFRLGFFLLGATLIVVPILKWGERSGHYEQSRILPKQPATCTDESDWYDWLKQGEYFLAQQRYQEAIDSFDRSIQENPCEAGTWQHEIEAQLMKCECLIALGDRTEAESIVKREQGSKSNNENPWLASRLAHVKKLLDN